MTNKKNLRKKRKKERRREKKRYDVDEARTLELLSRFPGHNERKVNKFKKNKRKLNFGTILPRHS